MWVIRDGREILDQTMAPRRVWPAARLLPPPPESPGDPPEIPSLPSPPEPSPWWLQAPWLLTAAVYGLLGPLAFGGRGWIYLLVLPATLLSSFLGTALQHRWAMRQHQRRVQETLETARRRLVRFLEAIERYRAAAEAQEQALFPSWEAMRARAQMGSDLWFRRSEDPDFLHVRVGRTHVPLLPSSLLSRAGRWPDPEEAPEPLRPSIQALHGLLQGRREAPLTVSLRAPWVWRAFPGQEGALFQIFLEAAIAHSPADISLMAALADPRWAFLRWLPHIGEEREGWADGPAAVRERIFEVLHRRRGHGDPSRTALLALLDEHALVDPRLGLLLSEGPRLGLFPQLILPWGAPAPAGVAGEVLLRPEGKVWILQHEGKWIDGSNSDSLLSPEEAEAIAQSLAGLRPQTIAAVPRAVSGPALWGVSGMEIVRPVSPPPPSLAVPIGVADDGEPFVLDLSDRAHGPHAMVIGATGSGKSEALRTLALALALHFPPERAQLLFIDFKGGGAFAPLEGLPHCVGLLSNLDAREAARALRTLEGELDRRQRVLAARGADHADQIGLPHLVVMADEFAEMLEAIPDGMARMIRLARLGRSLGMHLVLATQRLGSAVPADLRANLRVRIALRCETPDESAAVIGRPDAAYLVGSGWAFVQVGQNEVFRRIRVAYVSGRSLGAREILWMDPADPARRLRREVIGGEARRDLDVLVEALARMDPPAPRRTPPPLPADPGFPEREGKQEIGIGVADYPEIGEIRWIFLAPSAPDWRLVGQAGTGKTAALMAAAAAAARAGRRVAVVDGDGGWRGCPWAQVADADDLEAVVRLLREIQEGVLILDGLDRMGEEALERLNLLLSDAPGSDRLWIWTAARREISLRSLRGRPAQVVLLAMEAREWEALAGRHPIPDGPFRGLWMDGGEWREIVLRRALGDPPPPAPPLRRAADLPARWSALPPASWDGTGWVLPLGWWDVDLTLATIRLDPRRPALLVDPTLAAARGLLGRLAAQLAMAATRAVLWDPDGLLEGEPGLEKVERLEDPEAFWAALEAAEAAGEAWVGVIADADRFRMDVGYGREPPIAVRRPRRGASLVAGRDSLGLRCWRLASDPEDPRGVPSRLAAAWPMAAYLSAPGEGAWVLLPTSQ